MDAFLAAYMADLRDGRAQPLDAYRKRFPGHEAAIEAAWRECHDDAAPPPERGVPFESIGAYEIIRELGRGGQGVVYLARDTRLRRDVALKVFPRSASSPLVAMRMRREADALSRIDDRGICSIYEFGETAREAFIAMRYVRGTTLADEIRELARTPAEATPPARSRIRRVLRVVEEVARRHPQGARARHRPPRSEAREPHDRLGGPSGRAGLRARARRRVRRPDADADRGRPRHARIHGARADLRPRRRGGRAVRRIRARGLPLRVPDAAAPVRRAHARRAHAIGSSRRSRPIRDASTATSRATSPRSSRSRWRRILAAGTPPRSTSPKTSAAPRRRADPRAPSRRVRAGDSDTCGAARSSPRSA